MMKTHPRYQHPAPPCLADHPALLWACGSPFTRLPLVGKMTPHRIALAIPATAAAAQGVDERKLLVSGVWLRI